MVWKKLNINLEKIVNFSNTKLDGAVFCIVIKCFLSLAVEQLSIHFYSQSEIKGEILEKARKYK